MAMLFNINHESFCFVQFKKLIVSAVMTMVVITLTDTMDAVIAAQILGDNAMAGVRFIGPIMSLSAFLVLMIATGTSYLYSFEIGAFHDREANKLIGQGAFLTAVFSILLGLVIFFGEETFFSFFSDLGANEPFAREYYSCHPFIAALNMILVFMQMVVYADGGGNNCVIAIVLQFFVNISTSIFLGLKFGIVGIGTGTIIGYVAGILVLAKWIFKDSKTLKPVFYFSISKTAEIFKYSYVHASLYLYLAVSNMILNEFFLRTFGGKNFPILSVVFCILQFSLLLDGIGQAAEPLINIYLGEGNYDGIKKVMNIAIKTALLSGTLAIPMIYFLSANIAELFGIEADIFAEAVSAIKIIAFSMPFFALLYLFTTYFLIIRRFKIALALSFCKDFLFYSALPFIFSKFWKMDGFWLGCMSIPVVTCFIFAILLVMRYWGNFPLLLPSKDIISFDAKLNLDKVIAIRNSIEEELRKRNFTPENVMAIALLIEEMGALIVDNNPNSAPTGEFTVIFNGNPQIIIRDNGIHFDLTEEKIVSFRSFFLYGFFELSGTDRRYLTTQNYNRHIFTFLSES